jgi:enterobactin synthetase component D
MHRYADDVTLPAGLAAAYVYDVQQPSVVAWAAEQVLPVELRQSTESRQSGFWAGRFCAMQALQALGQYHPVALARLPDRRVAWPLGYVGSVSHSGSLAVAVVGQAQQWQSVAVDVQVWMTEIQAERLAGRILLPSELEWVNQQPQVTRAAWLSRMFSIKETLYKLLYSKALRYMPFDAAEVVQLDDQQATVCLSKDWSAEWPSGRCITVQIAADATAVLTWAALSQPVALPPVRPFAPRRRLTAR